MDVCITVNARDPVIFHRNTLKAKYNHISIPYPNDVENRMGAAEAKDVEIKQVRDLVLSQVSDRTMDNEKDRSFFYRLPEARCRKRG